MIPDITQKKSFSSATGKMQDQVLPGSTIILRCSQFVHSGCRNRPIKYQTPYVAFPVRISLPTEQKYSRFTLSIKIL